MNVQPRRRLLQRTPGERAFDNVLIFTLLGWIIASTLMAMGLPSKAVGVLALVVWIKVARNVFSAWRDPDFRILRISSMILLLFALAVVTGLFQRPITSG